MIGSGANKSTSIKITGNELNPFQSVMDQEL